MNVVALFQASLVLLTHHVYGMIIRGKTQPLTKPVVLQSNLAKQLAKLVKVKYVEDITAASRVGEPDYKAAPSLHSMRSTHTIACMSYFACMP